jgi:hypothetical protein
MSSKLRGLLAILAIFCASAANAQMPNVLGDADRFSAPEIDHIDFGVRGLYVQFEERGSSVGYWSGDVIHRFNDFDPVVNSTVSEEVALQLDKMASMGVNAITFELRTADGGTGPFLPPTCPIPLVLGLQWPQPTPGELANLNALLNLVHSKGMSVLLRLVNTHMEDLAGSKTWLGPVLGAIKHNPALALVLFEGDTHIDNGACGIPAEPPLWLGATAAPAVYVKWAIGYARSLGMPASKLSAEAIAGDFFVNSQPPAGPGATDGHLWNPIVVEDNIFNQLGIAPANRTYALSLYEHRKCIDAGSLPCVDEGPDDWAAHTLAGIRAIVGRAPRIVAPEMGDASPVDPHWQSDCALESLVALMPGFGVAGGSFWRWTSFQDSEDSDPTLSLPVKVRGVAFVYNPVEKVVVDWGRSSSDSQSNCEE